MSRLYLPVCVNLPAGGGHCRGFTLLEMIATLLIIAILAVIALPAHEGSLVKANRLAGKAYLMQMLTIQQQFFLEHQRYADTLSELGFPATLFINRQAEVAAASAPAAIYRIELASVGAMPGVRAVPVNRQRIDRHCLILSINLRGQRYVTGSQPATACWAS